MTVPPLLRAAAPMGIALAAAALVLVTASQLLPERVAVVHLRDGATALAASRADLLLIASVLLAALVIAWLVTAAALAWTPARHLLVPHAHHWKAAPHRRELRLRLARWTARAFAAAVWYVTALVLLALAAQGGGALAAWWLPLLVSGAYLLVVVGGAAWALGLGFAVDESARRAGQAAQTSVGGRGPAPVRQVAARTPSAPGGAVAGPRAGSPGPRAAGAAGPAAVRPAATRGARTAGAAVRTTGARGAPGRPPAAGDPDEKGPPRPYQPRPNRGGPPRG